MRSRDATLAAVRDRLARAVTDQDLSGILAVQALRDAEELTALTDSADLAAAYALGMFHWFRYLALPDRADQADLAAAARCLDPVFRADPQAVPEPLPSPYHQSYAHSGDTDPDPLASVDRAIELATAYERTGEFALLIKAVPLFRVAAATSPADHPDRAWHLSNLGLCLRMLGERTGEPAVLAEAVQASRDAVAATPATHPDRAQRLSALGLCLRMLGERTGEPAVLAEAVQASRDAVAATPATHPDRAGRLSGLGISLEALYERTGDTAILAEVVQASRDAVAAAPAGHPEHAAVLNNLGINLEILYERTGDTAVLAEVVQAGRDAVAATPATHPDRTRYLGNLGGALEVLGKRTGDTAVLAEAVQAGRDAIAATPAGHPNRVMYLGNLGGALVALYGRTGETAVLAEGVQASRDAVAAIPVGHLDRGLHLVNLGNVLRVLYERTGETAVLAEGVQASRDAVAAIPVGHLDRARPLTNLGYALRLLYERTGETAVLAEAVQAGRDAVAATPADHPDRAMYLTNLHNALQSLHERTGETAVLAEGVQAGRDAVAAIPADHPDHPDRAMYLTNLGRALQAMSARTGETAVLAEAVQASRDAVAAIPADHPGRATALNNLGAFMRLLYERTGDTAVLAEAVQAGRDAVAATPADRPDRAVNLSNLGDTLRVLSQGTGETAVLEEAVQVGREAVAATPAAHPDRARRLTSLGMTQRALYARTGETTALTQARRCFGQAAESTSAPASARISAYRLIAMLPLNGGGSAQDALAAVEAAVRLLPQVAPHALVRADREYSLGRLESLADEAAAAAVAAGQPGRAVELLEQTRGVLVADTLDARSSDLTRLRAQQPSLAAEFHKLRTRIDDLDHPGTAASQAADSPVSAASLAGARGAAYMAWDDLIARIRGIENFEAFLQPPQVHQLASQAQDGCVVFTYTCAAGDQPAGKAGAHARDLRCGALILTGDPATPVRPVPLPGLTEKGALQQTNRLLDARRTAGDPDVGPAARTKAQAEILEVLAWIWDTITGPVLSALGHTATPAEGQPWPRVWWCPVGFLAYLPLHAAGHHEDATTGRPLPRTVLDRVVSSYTTTMRGLAYARGQHPHPGEARTLIVAVPDAPGVPPLEGIAAEAAALASLIPGAHVLPHPTRDTVLAALPSHPVAHFACHGYADWAEPAASQLILYDYRTAPLTVADISARYLTGSLAYLSACDTAITSPALANEAVHITGAFHLAGYQHVIGTLWPINDTTASQLAEDFYNHLTHHGTTPPDTSRAPYAL